MTEIQHLCPGDIHFQLVYDRGQFAESSYLYRSPLTLSAAAFLSFDTGEAGDSEAQTPKA